MTKRNKDFSVIVGGYNCVCTPIGRQEYSNCYFEAGSVVGHPNDTMYLRLWRDDKDEPLTVLLRPDEAQAIMWVLSGMLWSMEMQKGNSNDSAG